MGPIIIFDKSTLQCLSVDESVWLENFFVSNITPLFYIEILADLEKDDNKRTPQEIVGNLAIKTPQQFSYPNTNYFTLIINDLFGNLIEMSNRIVLSGGEIKVSPDGRIGIHYDFFPEAEVMNRWQEGKFLEVERDFAKQWRQSLSNINFDLMIGMIKNIVPQGKRFKKLKEIKDFVDQFVKGNAKEIYFLTFEVLGIHKEFQHRIILRWQKDKCPPISEFAPYAAYVLRINLFFYLSLASGLISKERPSNIIDLTYLYYLPFCMIFTSNDKLHKRTAKLFMENGQIFVEGQDLKNSLKELDDYYSNLAGEIKSGGINKFAAYLPLELDTLLVRLWDNFLPNWRKLAKKKEQEQPVPEETEKKMVRNIKKQIRDAIIYNGEKLPEENKISRVIFKRNVLTRKGKWRLIPQEVEKSLKDKKS